MSQSERRQRSTHWHEKDVWEREQHKSRRKVHWVKGGGSNVGGKLGVSGGHIQEMHNTGKDGTPGRNNFAQTRGAHV